MTIAGSVFSCIWGDLCVHILLRWMCEWELPGSMHWGWEMPVPKFRSGVENFKCQSVGGGWGEIQQAKFRMGRERSRRPRFGMLENGRIFQCLLLDGQRFLGP